jgi:hypothetical protein
MLELCIGELYDHVNDMLLLFNADPNICIVSDTL